MERELVEPPVGPFALYNTQEIIIMLLIARARVRVRACVRARVRACVRVLQA